MASRGAVVGEHAHLDQAVGVQRGVDFLFDGGGQAVAADHDHRVEVVGFGAVFLALGGGELDGGMPYYRGRHESQTKSKKVNKAWLHDHVNDPYVKLAQREGYRARAAYKLKEIDETLGLIKPGQVVVDLGSAPGAWSQYLRRRFAPTGAAWGAQRHASSRWTCCRWTRSRACTFLQGDFREPAVLQQLERPLAGPAGGRGGVGHGAQPVGHRVGRRGAHRRTWWNWRWISPSAT
jgi:hypothetical protein